MRSDTAFFSAAVISRRFLCGLTSGWLSAEAAVAFLGEERRDAERAAGAEVPRICSTSVKALIAWSPNSGKARVTGICDESSTTPVVHRRGPSYASLVRARYAYYRACEPRRPAVPLGRPLCLSLVERLPSDAWA